MIAMLWIKSRINALSFTCLQILNKLLGGEIRQLLLQVALQLK